MFDISFKGTNVCHAIEKDICYYGYKLINNFKFPHSQMFKIIIWHIIYYSI